MKSHQDKPEAKTKEPLSERDSRKSQERNPDKLGQTAGIRQNTHNQGYQQDR
jgi:hypothetical protein